MKVRVAGSPKNGNPTKEGELLRLGTDGRTFVGTVSNVMPSSIKVVEDPTMTPDKFKTAISKSMRAAFGRLFSKAEMGDLVSETVRASLKGLR
jgi:hypothetical protein